MSDGISSTNVLGIELPDLSGVSNEYLDDAERELQSAAKKIRQEIHSRVSEDAERLRGWERDKHITPADAVTESALPLDHLWCIKRPGHSTTFISEPYEISTPHLLPILLSAWGGRWSVTIRADQADWFPGHTMAVVWGDSPPQLPEWQTRFIEGGLGEADEKRGQL